MRKTLRSFYYAFRGIAFALRNERNFIIECSAGVMAIASAFWFPLTSVERAVIILTVSLVLSLELINTALERVMDILKPRIHPYARVIKDAMAGAVFLAALAAFFVGVSIFSPHIF